MTPPALPKASRSVWFWLFLLLMAAHALVVLVAPTPPVLQDYPDWVYQGVLLAKLLAHHPAPGYVLHHYPVPNSLTTLGIALLTLAAGWQQAARLWILLVLAAVACGTLQAVKRLGLRNLAILPVLACSVFLGLDFWNGSINFQLGIALLLFLVAHLLRPRASPYLTSLLLLLCFFTHMLPCAAGLLALTALALEQKNWRRFLPAIPTLVCLAWYTLARDPNALPSPAPSHLLPAFLAVTALLLWFWRKSSPSSTVAQSLLFSPGTFAAAPLLLVVKSKILLASCGLVNVLPSFPRQDQIIWRPELFRSFAAIGILAAILLTALLLGAWGRLRKPGTPYKFLVCTSLTLAVLFLLLPSDALGVTGIDSRFFHLSLALGLLLLGSSNTRWLLTLGVLSSLICGASLYQFIAVERDNASISLRRGTPLLLGTPPVAPAVRFHYYNDLQRNTFNNWIFPTAMFSNPPN